MPTQNQVPPLPVKVQLCLQGGGAKLVDLLAALAAVKKLEADKKIQVTRIAGASAGALAGCLYAAGHDPRTLWQSLRQDQEVAGLLKNFKLPGKLGLATALLWKEAPLWDAAPLRKILLRLFKDKGKTLLKDLQPPVLVMTTDLCQSGKAVASAEKQIVPALLDSCGLPFLFRVWSPNVDGALLVDGGLCENLPVTELVEAKKEAGAIVAITFKPPIAQTPTKILDFCKALLFAAIDNSVARAKAHPQVDYVQDIETELTTLSFQTALSDTYGPAFQLTYERTLAFFNDVVARETKANIAVAQNPWLAAKDNKSFDALLATNFNLYETVFSKERIDLEEVLLEAITFEGVPMGDGPARHDRMKTYERFRPRQPLRCYWHGFNYADTYVSKYVTRWTVSRLGPDLKPIASVSTLDLPTQNHKRGPGILLVFAEPLETDALYEITVIDEGTDLMGRLWRAHEDVFQYETLINTNRRMHRVEFRLIHAEQSAVKMTSSACSQMVGRSIPAENIERHAKEVGQHMAACGLCFEHIDADVKLVSADVTCNQVKF